MKSKKIRYSIRKVRSDDEFERFDSICNDAFLPRSKDWLKHENRDALRIITAGDTIAGGLLGVSMGQWFGGCAVPMLGIRAVAVSGEYRGAGAAIHLMRGVVREARRRRFPISALYPATHHLYRKAGYELAGTQNSFELPLASLPRGGRSYTVEEFDLADWKVAARIYAERAARTAGHLDRTEWAWKQKRRQEGEKPRGYLVISPGGEPEGYFISVAARTPGNPFYDFELSDWVTLTRGAAERSLAFFGDSRSMARKLRWSGAPGEPVEYVLGEDMLKANWSVRWMIRIVDVKSALEARGWPSSVRAELHLDLTDDLIRENRGRWVLSVKEGGATVRRGGRGSLRLDIRGLAPLYSGYMTPRDLLSIDRLGGTPKAIATASTLFAGPSPWMVDWF